MVVLGFRGDYVVFSTAFESDNGREGCAEAVALRDVTAVTAILELRSGSAIGVSRTACSEIVDLVLPGAVRFKD